MTVLGELIKNLRIDFLKEAKSEEKTRKKLTPAKTYKILGKRNKRAHIKHVVKKNKENLKSSGNAHLLCKRDSSLTALTSKPYLS